jgi:hypothetical protein
MTLQDRCTRYLHKRWEAVPGETIRLLSLNEPGAMAFIINLWAMQFYRSVAEGEPVDKGEPGA